MIVNTITEVAVAVSSSFAEIDVISDHGIKKYLNQISSELSLDVFKSVGSTNDLAKEKAVLGVREGYVVIANEQTAGRGRRGKTFFSPVDTGIYMSLVLRPSDCFLNDSVKLTTMAAVSVCEAIETVCSKKAEIKWVNDVYISGKKVCGILTETLVGLEKRTLEYAILGIGLNLYPPKNGFPDDLTNIAGSIFDARESDGKNRIAAEILNKFMGYYRSSQEKHYIDEYRSRNFVVGKEVDVICFDDRKKATVLNIDDDCHLIVRYENGELATLSSGEVSVRLS